MGDHTVQPSYDIFVPNIALIPPAWADALDAAADSMTRLAEMAGYQRPVAVAWNPLQLRQAAAAARSSPLSVVVNGEAGTPLDSAVEDSMMGAAAFEDAMNTLSDLIPDTELADRDAATLESNRDALQLILGRANAVIGSLIRVGDRVNLNHLKSGNSNGH